MMCLLPPPSKKKGKAPNPGLKANAIRCLGPKPDNSTSSLPRYIAIKHPDNEMTESYLRYKEHIAKQEALRQKVAEETKDRIENEAKEKAQVSMLENMEKEIKLWKEERGVNNDKEKGKISRRSSDSGSGDGGGGMKWGWDGGYERHGGKHYGDEVAYRHAQLVKIRRRDSIMDEIDWGGNSYLHRVRLLLFLPRKEMLKMR